jgi:hypothetical protein
MRARARDAASRARLAARAALTIQGNLKSIGQIADIGRNIGQIVKHGRNIGSIADQISERIQGDVHHYHLLDKKCKMQQIK